MEFLYVDYEIVGCFEVLDFIIFKILLIGM